MRCRLFRTRVSFRFMSNIACRPHLRLHPDTVEFLVGMVQHLASRSTGQGGRGHLMPVEVKLTAALNIYATGSFQPPAGDLCGISQSSVHRCVIDALIARAADSIRLELGQSQVEARAAGLAAMSGMPSVQRADDCTHVAIRAPVGHPRRFMNRKGLLLHEHPNHLQAHHECK